MAYEVPNFDGLMRGAGRMKQQGFNVEWGVGRHGPGDNIFSYFIEPNGFVTEYTTEIEQIDESIHMPGTAEYWAKKMPMPDRWGMALPSQLLREAMSGKLTQERNLRCEDIISAKLAS
jgi:catechol 2,3-dioxygenase